MPYLLANTEFNKMYFAMYYELPTEEFNKDFLIVYLDDYTKEWIEIDGFKLVRFRDGIKAN
ncbi:MAG: hypothetical protein K2X77_06980 [Candidatus Obscuribacterales bacterium]|jgi:hypothetical protein|nr:hypothetical protein [Candidatus Obscuribacterales bacterium]